MSSLYETFSREWARDRYSPRVVGVLEQLAAGVLKCVREKLRTADSRALACIVRDGSAPRDVDAMKERDAGRGEVYYDYVCRQMSLNRAEHFACKSTSAREALVRNIVELNYGIRRPLTRRSTLRSNLTSLLVFFLTGRRLALPLRLSALVIAASLPLLGVVCGLGVRQVKILRRRRAVYARLAAACR